MTAQQIFSAFICIGLLTLRASAALNTLPNIILVMPDDVGYGDYACLGNPIIHTPATDAFWQESVRFVDFHVSPTCAPTRAALMTGRHEFKNGVTHTILERERLTRRAKTLAQVLKSVGYATGIFGKWHLGDEQDRWPDKRGFDEMFIHGAGGIGQTYEGSCGDAPGNTYFNPTVLHNGKFEKTNGYCTDVFFKQATNWIESVKEKQPFFAYITPNAAHEPLHIPDEYFRHYERKVSDDVAKFYGMIENVDQNFGKLLNQLKEWSLEENTLVIFITDNGTATGDKVFNGGPRVPSFWRWPARFKGNIDCPALTAHIDVLPTLAEIVDAKLDESLKHQIEGQSFLSLLLDHRADWPNRTLVTHVGRWPRGEAAQAKHHNCSIRDERYSLVNNRELYDLRKDPAESQNVIGDHPKIVARLRAIYDAWWQSTLTCLENEEAVGPTINPFKELYWKQFGRADAAAPKQ